MALTPEQLAAAQVNYDQWRRTNGKANWWTPEAGAAAASAGLYPNLKGKELAGWREEFTPWGENIWINPQGQQAKIANPAWQSFVRNFMAQHPGSPASAGAQVPTNTAAPSVTVPGGQQLQAGDLSAPGATPNTLAGALSLFKSYQTQKQPNNTNPYYNPVQFHGYQLI